jgi:hypothetical protein
MGKGSWPHWLRRRRAPPLLDLQDFRECVVAAIRKRHPNAEVDQFGDDGVWITPEKDSGAFTLNVARFHALYCREPRDLERLITQLADTPWRHQPSTTRKPLRLLVRPDTYLTEASTDEGRQICRHIAGALWAIVAVDEGDAISFPSAMMLRADLGMDDAAIWEKALANTRRQLGPLQLPSEKSVQVFIAKDGYASSYLADDELWRRLDEEAPDGLLAVPLETNVFCVFGSFSPDAAYALPDLLAVSEASADHLSSVALTRRNDRWIEAAEIDRAFAPGRPKH